MFETFKAIKWEKFLKMVGEVKSNIGLKAFTSGEMWSAEAEGELVNLHRACQELEESVWRLWRLSRNDAKREVE